MSKTSEAAAVTSATDALAEVQRRIEEAWR
jgi:hypothetical protein